MLVFAWILWSIFTFSYAVVFIACLILTVLDKWDGVNLKVSGISFFLDIAVYIFLNLYIFAR